MRIWKFYYSLKIKVTKPLTVKIKYMWRFTTKISFKNNYLMIKHKTYILYWSLYTDINLLISLFLYFLKSSKENKIYFFKQNVGYTSKFNTMFQIISKHWDSHCPNQNFLNLYFLNSSEKQIPNFGYSSKITIIKKRK